MVAAIMYVKAVITQSKSDIDAVQAIETGVYRYFLGVAGYVAVAVFRGEIDASMVETRMMEATLLYAKDSLDGKYENITRNIHHQQETSQADSME